MARRPRGRNTAQTARSRLREEGLTRDDIMLAYLYHPGAVSGQHTPRGIWEMTGKGSRGEAVRAGRDADPRPYNAARGFVCEKETPSREVGTVGWVGPVGTGRARKA